MVSIKRKQVSKSSAEMVDVDSKDRVYCSLLGRLSVVVPALGSLSFFDGSGQLVKVYGPTSFAPTLLILLLELIPGKSRSRYSSWGRRFHFPSEDTRKRFLGLNGIMARRKFRWGGLVARERHLERCVRQLYCVKKTAISETRLARLGLGVYVSLFLKVGFSRGLKSIIAT